jgi:hypothetical protein
MVMSGNETKTDLLAQELRDLYVEVAKLTQNLSIEDVEILKKGNIPSPGGILFGEICMKYRRIKELENALNMVC